ncbi:MAG: polyprenyl synthetase family protein [Bacteroidota bacterium]
MYTLVEAQALIEKHIENLRLPEQPEALYEPVRYILSNGGKRIRPALVLLSCNLFSDGVEQAVMPALAIEIFHNFTLMHDDIMDRSEIRRGKETVHVKWNNNTAILSGDVMSIYASRLINKAPGAVLEQVHEVFTRTAIAVCEGQQYDMDFESRIEVGEAEYLKMIELKTAVLIAASLRIGAMVGGASQLDADDLYRFGLNLGLAFQLQDDLLDTFGDEKLFGKKTGMDIVNNKKTFLMIKALERAGEKQREELLYWQNTDPADPEKKIEAVKSIFSTLNIEQITRDKVTFYYNEAMANLSHLGVSQDKKGELYYFAEFLLSRNQ